MTREEFERLLSDWLDEPLRADLHELMESACVQSPDLIVLREAWRKSHAITRESPAQLYDVDWRAQRARVQAAIDAEIGAIMDPGARELEDLVSLAMPTLGVDWAAQRAKISARLDDHVAHELRPGPLDNVLAETDPADVNWRSERARIAAATTRATRRLRMLRWTGLATTITAAAAAIALFFVRPADETGSATVDEAIAAVTIVDASGVVADATTEAVTLAISAPEDFEIAAADGADEAEDSSDLYFAIEPAPILAAGS